MTTTRRTTEISVLDSKTVTVIGPWPQTDSATLSLYISTISARLDRDQAVKLRDALDAALEADHDQTEAAKATEAEKAAAAREQELTDLHDKYRAGDLVIVARPAYATVDAGDPFAYVEEDFFGKAGTVSHADPAAGGEPAADIYTDHRVVTVKLGDGDTNYIHVAHLRNISLEVREGTFPEADLAKLTDAPEPVTSLSVGDEVTVDGRPAKVTSLDPEDTLWPYAIEFTDRPGSDWVRPVNCADHSVLTGEYPDALG